MPSVSATRMHSALVSVICVDAWIGNSGLIVANQPHQPQVLHQHGIDARLGQSHDRLLNRRPARRKTQAYSASHSPARPARADSHHLGQLVEVQVRRPGPRVEPGIQPEVNRVGPVLDGRRDTNSIAAGESSSGRRRKAFNGLADDEVMEMLGLLATDRPSFTTFAAFSLCPGASSTAHAKHSKGTRNAVTTKRPRDTSVWPTKAVQLCSCHRLP